MIRPNFQTTLEGSLLTAFQIYCAKRGCQTAAEGFRNMIRESQEFKELSAPSEMKKNSIGNKHFIQRDNSGQGKNSDINNALKAQSADG